MKLQTPTTLTNFINHNEIYNRVLFMSSAKNICPTCGNEKGINECVSVENLTKTELKVLSNIINNPEKPFKQIADNLNLSINTITNHAQHIYRKTNCNSKTELYFKYHELV